MAERRAGARGGGLHRADARRHRDLDRRPVAAPLTVDRLENERCETVNPGIARRDERDRAPFGREIEREPHPLLFGADLAVVTAFADERATEQIEIETIADHVVRSGEQRARFRRAPRRIAGADADDCEPAARPADRRGVQRHRRARNCARRAARLAAPHDQRAAGTGGRERRAFRDAPTAGRAERRLGAHRQPRGLVE